MKYIELDFAFNFFVFDYEVMNDNIIQIDSDSLDKSKKELSVD